jgi:hypothetical protein
MASAGPTFQTRGASKLRSVVETVLLLGLAMQDLPNHRMRGGPDGGPPRGQANGWRTR